MPWVIAGDNGELLRPFTAAVARGAAEHFGKAQAVSVDGPLDYDQWIVHQRFDAYRPFFRVRLDDAAHSDLYVSARTGEVLQRTRISERAWNWCGAVMHWIYFTPLRKSWSAWNQIVWWLSLAALLASMAGTWLGVVRFASNRALRRGGLSPFRGWMRWHHIAYDALYRLAESIPDDAVGFNVSNADESLRVYVAPVTGRLLAVMDPSRRAYAWVYYALHTLNFPGLSTHAGLHTAVVLTLLAVGLAFSVTGVVLGVFLLKRQF